MSNTEAQALLTGLKRHFPAAAESLAQVSRFLRFDVGAIVINETQEGRDVFLVLEGAGRAVLFSENGHEIRLGDIREGEMFGEIAALTGTGRTSNVVAETPMAVARLTSSAFTAVMAENGAFARDIAAILAARLSETSRRMFELSALSSPGRVYAELLRLAKPVEGRASDEWVIKPAPPLIALAARVNVTRETASRTVNDLARRGLIIRTDDQIVVLAPDKLTAML
ncbi:MAG: Crp/Fnr family transcriptional regulator [Maricaulaceae bacterium]